MTKSTLFAFTTAALLVAGSAVACPKKDKPKEPTTDDAAVVYEVLAYAPDKAKDGDRPERGEKGEKGDKGEKGERPKRGEGPEGRGDRGPGEALRGLDLTEDQQEKAKEIFESAREAAMALREKAKADAEDGKEVDREAIREKMREIHMGAMKQVYDEVLTDEQRAKVDKRREEMEKRRAEREKRGEGEEGDRPRRKRGEGDGEGPERPRKRGGDEGLDL